MLSAPIYEDVDVSVVRELWIHLDSIHPARPIRAWSGGVISGSLCIWLPLYTLMAPPFSAMRIRLSSRGGRPAAAGTGNPSG